MITRKMEDAFFLVFLHKVDPISLSSLTAIAQTIIPPISNIEN